jgi:2-deoxy-D-gluconate 3-dehydrogenase
MKRFDLSGKVAIVTGGNGGIGEGLARGLLECSATVVIAGRNEAKNATAVAELGKIGPVSAVATDVVDEKQCRALIAETVRRHGGSISCSITPGSAVVASTPTRFRSNSGIRSSTPI